MTVKRRSAQSSHSWFAAFAAAAALFACASPDRINASSEPAPAPTTAPVVNEVIDPSGVKLSVSPAQVVDGSITLISVQLPKDLEGKPVKGDFDGIPLPFFKSGDSWVAVLGVPYDHKAGLAAAQVTLGEGEDARKLDAPFTVVPGEYASETLKVDGRRVKPQNPKDLKRIKKELAEIGEVYNTVTPRKYWDGPFALPLEAPFTSRYGTRRVYNGVQKSAHLGLDFKAAVGTPIHASAPGRVALAKNLFFTGYTVIVDHGYGVLTLYAHLDKLKVKKGEVVKTGQLLGLSGKTGRVTGPHLHWMAIIHKQKVNPQFLTQVMK